MLTHSKASESKDRPFLKQAEVLAYNIGIGGVMIAFFERMFALEARVAELETSRKIETAVLFTDATPKRNYEVREHSEG